MALQATTQPCSHQAHQLALCSSIRANRTRRSLLSSQSRQSAHSSKASALPAGLRLRQGKASDADDIWRMTVRERMNPLGLAPERFVIVQDDQRAKILGIGQMQPQGSFQELRTLIVEPECRGKGVGTAIVEELVQRAQNEAILLTTLKRTMPFYAPHGFSQVTGSSLPRALWLEVTAGTVVARIVAGDELVVMGRKWP